VLVVVRSGVLAHTLPVAVTEREVVVNQDIKAFDSGSRELNEWLAVYLRSHERSILNNNRKDGSTVQSIRVDELLDLEVLVPPLAEQRRIVARLETLLADVSLSRERLANVAAILRRLRQAVLSDACKAVQSVGLGEVLESVTYGTARKCLPDVAGTPVLRIPNIAKGVVDRGDLKFAKLEKQEREKLALRAGDLLMVGSNGSVSLVGRTALVSGTETGFAFAGYLMRLRCDDRRALPSYVNLALRTYQVRQQIEIPARSTSGVHNINADEVRNLRIPLPPVSVQREIVRRIGALSVLADTIERQVAAASARADRLVSSILAKAFRGELVPREADLARHEGREYESASVLLERIDRLGSKKKMAPSEASVGRARGHQAGRRRRGGNVLHTAR
jgi:type I restriction enzyme S subunit